MGTINHTLDLCESLSGSLKKNSARRTLVSLIPPICCLSTLCGTPSCVRKMTFEVEANAKQTSMQKDEICYESANPNPTILGRFRGRFEKGRTQSLFLLSLARTLAPKM